MEFGEFYDPIHPFSPFFLLSRLHLFLVLILPPTFQSCFCFGVATDADVVAAEAAPTDAAVAAATAAWPCGILLGSRVCSLLSLPHYLLRPIEDIGGLSGLL